MAFLHILSLISTPLVAAIVYYFYRDLRTTIHFRKVLQKNNCGEPKWALDKLPFGLDSYFKAIQVFRRGGDLIDEVMTPRYEQFGPTYRSRDLFGGNFTFTADPENVQTVLALKFKDYVLGDITVKLFTRLLGHGIFTSDGAEWEHFRSQIRPQFSRSQISDLDTLERHVQELFDVIPTTDASGWTSKVDLGPMFFRLTMDVSTEFLFGVSVHSQRESIRGTESEKKDDPSDQKSLVGKESNKPNEMSFAEAMKVAVDHVEDGIRIDRLFGLLTNKRFNAARDIVHGFAGDMVRQVLDRMPADGEKKNKETGKKKFILAEELAAEIKDPIELRTQLLHVLAAGRDTTATLLSWIFLMFVTEPEATAKLRQEVLSNFGPEGSDEEITFEKLKATRYLQWFINETLRLYSIVAINQRVANKDTILPVGGGPDGRQPVPVLKGEIVVWSSWHMHRRRDIWGEDADVFRPERWENKKSGWFYVPFHGGPRLCLGQQFALTEVSFAIVRFMQRFDAIEGVGDPSELLKKGVGVVMMPMHGVPVRLHRAGKPS
ncbi:MAG: hypothetical protein M1823_004863 [Watsoniomyces obsoletus]|nr:MAG: hypothetical protein M1823_004863 [Watsoniomyces obsoletus]